MKHRSSAYMKLCVGSNDSRLHVVEPPRRRSFNLANWSQLIHPGPASSLSNYATPAWSTNASDTSLGKIQHTQNEELRIITRSHKMSSIDHLHSETKMLPVEDHLNLLSAQYLVHCLDTENVCHPHHHVGSSTEGNEGDTFH